MSVSNARTAVPVARARPSDSGALLPRLIQSPTVARLIGGLLILVIWEVTVRAFAPAYVAKPSNILPVFFPVLTSEAMLTQAWATLTAVIQGLALSIAGGVVLGLSMGRIRFVDRLLRVYVTGLYAMPMTAILPLLTIWLGYSSSARLATIVFASIFPIAMSVCDGARSVPHEYLEVARSYRARWHHVWFGITLASSLPYLFAGMKLAVGRALIGAVVAEFFISVDGLGFYILFNTRTFHHNAAFVAVILLAAFAVAVDWLMDWGTHKFLPWYRAAERRQ
jgi:ABC-type nitrate/sulfonate/bicarbonate transport system permease component